MLHSWICLFQPLFAYCIFQNYFIIWSGFLLGHSLGPQNLYRLNEEELIPLDTLGTVTREPQRNTRGKNPLLKTTTCENKFRWSIWFEPGTTWNISNCLAFFHLFNKTQIKSISLKIIINNYNWLITNNQQND